MKRIILIYGLLAGTIVGSMFFITMPLYEKGILTMENGELVGYSTMIVALSLIFFGVKSYRDNQLEGSISFGKALQVGLLITLIASLMYAITWEVIYNTMTDFVAQMGDKYFEKLRADGITLHRVNISQILARFGISESGIRRSMAIPVANGNQADESVRGSVGIPRPVVSIPSQLRIPRPAPVATKAPKTAGKTEAVKTPPPGKQSSPSEDLKRKDQSRVEFKPNPRPRKEDLI